MIGLIMLVVLVVYLLVVIFVTRWVLRIPKRTSRKWIIGLISLAVFALIPTWDVILGRMYFNHLCETEGGVRVYKTVELGPEYWEKDGKPKFVSEDSYLDKTLLDGKYIRKTNFQENYGAPFRITLAEDLIADAKTDEIHGKKTAFIYFGGWFVNSTGAHVTGTTCHRYKLGYYEDLLSRIFIPATDVMR